jgi:DNA-directed RNA polymerase III subunit RPC6
MVYSYVESAGAAGIWTKTIRAKTQLHMKIVEKSYKSLEQKGLIKQMKNVKNPGRKMYILSRLKPNEDATGGTWYTNDELDTDLLENVADTIEAWVSLQSWVQVAVPEPVTGQKRKAPADGFDIKGKGKARAGSIAIHEEDRSRHKAKPEYKPHTSGYSGYPTVHDITHAMNEKRVITTILPVNAIFQLIEVMVLDDKLIKRQRDPILGNIAEEQEAANSGVDKVTMYRHLTKPDTLHKKMTTRNRAGKGNVKAARGIELEDIGLGGSTEVPCLRCPVFDICEDGPVNAKTCTYWDAFWRKMEEADDEAAARQKVHDIDETEIL